MSAAVAVRFAGDGRTVEEARVVLGAVASRPQPSPEAANALVGRELSDGVLEEAATLASKVAKPMDNTDFTLHWRKRVTREFVTYALREVCGYDMCETRARIARHSLAFAGA